MNRHLYLGKPTRRRWARLFFVPVLMLLPASLFSGCGYQVRATGEPVGITLRNLAIPLVASTSSEAGFESDFTRIIREEFISHARVPLVPEDEAQAILLGKVTEIRTEAIGFRSRDVTVGVNTTTYETTTRRRLRIKLDMRMVDRKSGQVLWHDGAMEAKALFAVSSDPLATRYNQKLALLEIGRVLAKRVYLKTMERF